MGLLRRDNETSHRLTILLPIPMEKQLEYSQKTQKLLDKICHLAERQSFRLYKKRGGEALLKTYDLFGLKRPSKIVWCTDIFDDKLASASSASSVYSAYSAYSAYYMAIDYDFGWYMYTFEYRENPDKDNPINENDLKYLEYCELLMQAKQCGIWYWFDWEDTLYLVPVPIVKLDAESKVHSLTEPAVKWKNGAAFYYIWGVEFEKDLWQQVVNREMKAKDIMNLTNIEQRMTALKIKGNEKVIRELGGVLVDTWEDYRLFEVKDIFSETAYFLEYSCPSTQRIYVSGVDPKIGKKKSSQAAIAWKFNCTPEEYKSILAHS